MNESNVVLRWCSRSWFSTRNQGLFRSSDWPTVFVVQEFVELSCREAAQQVQRRRHTTWVRMLTGTIIGQVRKEQAAKAAKPSRPPKKSTFCWAQSSRSAVSMIISIVWLIRDSFDLLIISTALQRKKYISFRRHSWTILRGFSEISKMFLFKRMQIIESGRQKRLSSFREYDGILFNQKNFELICRPRWQVYHINLLPVVNKVIWLVDASLEGKKYWEERHENSVTCYS